MDSATTKYQLALPFLLQSVSPGLAALHASRARRLHPEDSTLHETHCARCGTFFGDGRSDVRVVRQCKRRKVPGSGESSGRSQAKRVLKTTCGTCGRVQERVVEAGNARNFPKAGRNFDRRGVSGAAASGQATAPLPNTKGLPGGELSKTATMTSMTEPATVPPVPEEHGPLLSPDTYRLDRSRSDSPSIRESAGRKSSETPCPTTSSTPNPSSLKRPKKKSGLQELLARNRERERQEQSKKRGGLADFLSGL